MTEFPCPHCRILLRIREVTFRNRTIDCPDCQQPVYIQEVNGKLIGVVPRPGGNENLHAQLRPKSRWGAPQLVAGGVSLAIFALIMVYSLSPFRSSEGEQPVVVPPPTVAPAGSSRILPPATMMPVRQPETATDTVPQPETIPAAPVSQQETQMRGIARLIEESVGQHETYPQETAGQKSGGWSWIAELAEQHLPGRVSRHKDAGWDAAVNDEFVRRTFPEFQNPALSSKAGDDNYPSSHYIGIAGVSGTQQKLGLFGHGRPIRPADVKDGLAETILVAGANSHHGSWARPGKATIRAFSQEPYINGPDGIGTGQADGMYVLMADGSVRFLNQATDPEVLRRLAAVSDSESPAPSVVITPVPAGNPEGGVMAPGQATSVPAADAPVVAPVAPEHLRVDLQARLNQRLVGFEQSRAIPLQDVLFDIQELLGVRIDLTKLPEEIRQRPVKISLKATTVGDVLREIATAADVGYAIHPDHISIQTK